MARLLLIGTNRHWANCYDFDLLYRNSPHQIVKVAYHQRALHSAAFCRGNGADQTRDMCSNLRHHPHKVWRKYRELKEIIQTTPADYLCLGNGCDKIGLELQADLGSSRRFLFSEYGWLPWRECFYIDDKGCGANSSIARLTDTELPPECLQWNQQVVRLQTGFSPGSPVRTSRPYVYVPLQTDTKNTKSQHPDFKFQFTKHASNSQFLQFLRGVVPESYDIYARDHPLAKYPTKMPAGVTNIAGRPYSKASLYNQASAVIGINSTSLLEALLFGCRVFSYGEDVFSNKSLTWPNVQTREDMTKLLAGPSLPLETQMRFLYLLLERQVCRASCEEPNYVRSHYWVRTLEE